jgi:Protein of unknown function (DUF2867)
MKARLACVPEQSVLQSSLHSASFFDAYEVENPQAERSPLAIWLDTVQKTPRWVNQSMALRNAVVGRLGLKHAGDLSSFDFSKKAQDYRVGDRVGIFTVYEISENEVVMGEVDKHLDVRLSLFKSDQGARVVVSTVVHVKNWLGHLYMFFVKPMHRIIAPTVLSKI